MSWTIQTPGRGDDADWIGRGDEACGVEEEPSSLSIEFPKASDCRVVQGVEGVVLLSGVVRRLCAQLLREIVPSDVLTEAREDVPNVIPPEPAICIAAGFHRFTVDCDCFAFHRFLPSQDDAPRLFARFQLFPIKLLLRLQSRIDRETGLDRQNFPDVSHPIARQRVFEEEPAALAMVRSV